MIYDCFMFFNELDILEIRLNILNDIVDKFVLVEGNKTCSGTDKEFIFEKNKQRYEKFLDKIIHIKVDDFPKLEESAKDDFGNRWILENFQRDAIMRGLINCKDDDIVLISDVDEIPNPKAIKNYKNGIGSFEQKFMYYFLNNHCLEESIWIKAKIGRYSDLLNPNQDLPSEDCYGFSKKGLPTYFRFCQGQRIKNGGWHFSYCGGVEAIIKKRQSIVSQQFNTDENMKPDVILQNIQKGKDILERPDKTFLAIPLDRSFPKYILNNQEKYKHLILQCSKWSLFKNKIIRILYRIKTYKPEIHIRKYIVKIVRILIPVKTWRENLKKFMQRNNF